MCGIVGVFNYRDNIGKQLSYIDWCLETMHHRGPDSNAVWTNEQNYVAGFVRLSIRDLSANGDQPMVSGCGNFVLSFNGELYNTDGFKQRLQNEGVVFKSTTDTEVLLYGLIKWGEEFVLQNFDGIFAFAFYNSNTNQLLLARDRSGVKPLYIGHSSKGIVYSSQYDHIINHEYIKDNELDTGAIGAYLSLGYVPENSGAVSSTFMIPHGYYLTVENTGFNKKRFYKYSLHQTHASVKSLEQILSESVSRQLVSDVPVGTFMSGGVDSPLVSYFASKQTQIRSFTIGVNDNEMDESKAAACYAQLFKTQHHCKQITETDLLQTIDDNTKAFTEPFADFSSIPTLLLSAFARQKVTVALSGDGGDELFWGYPRNTRMLNEGLAFKHNKIVRLLNFGKEKVSNTKRTLRKRHIEVNDFPAYYYKSLFITGAEYWLPEVYKETIEQAFFLNELYKENGVSDVNEKQVMDTVRKLEYDIHLQRILLKVDRASMYHSLEVRVPLLGNDVVDYSSTLDYEDCIMNGHGKYNLKELLISKTNRELVLQPKKGFTIPIGNWMKNQLRRDVEDKVMNMPAELAMLFNGRELTKIVTQHMEGKNDWGWLLWSLYSLVNWHSTHRVAR